MRMKERERERMILWIQLNNSPDIYLHRTLHELV